MGLLNILFKNPSDVYLKQKKIIGEKINTLEKEVSSLTREDFLGKVKLLQQQIEKGTTAEKFLPEVFALTREASKRTLKQRHFDVQILAGIALSEGRVVEMRTGEGKTLAATLSATLNALSGKGVHVVTVNDYLAQRDAIWMGQIYHYLGLTVGCIVQEGAFLYDPEYKIKEEAEKEELDEERDTLGSFRIFKEFLRPVSRSEAYQADITYGTNTEFGFDYLRDHLIYSENNRVQRGHHYALIDEVDSVLIDEARTPLIISFPDEEAGQLYQKFSSIVSQFKEEIDFTADDKNKTVSLTEEGLDKIERIFGFNIFDEKGLIYVHHLETALRSYRHYQKDRDYIVKDGQVMIVDEFTGRILKGRRYSGGLHQALEAKERVSVQNESRTIATVTLQNYFRMYEKLAGMTGTAATSAEEFKKVYDLDTVIIPTNKPMVRKDFADKVFRTQAGKLQALVREVGERYQKGQPVLIGTPSVEKNELLEAYFKKAGIPCNILNAKNHAREGEIIAQAGKSKAVTVATNMAGRGVDIVLGGNPPDEDDRKNVVQWGGLHVIGTERHEARRIDDQLRGRSGRQGDPGSSQFFVSLEDDLMLHFAPKYLGNLMKKLNWPEDEPIIHPMVNKAIEMAQSKIEGFYFDIRKHVLEYDDIINKQRIAIYRKRDALLEKDPRNFIEYLKNTFQEEGKEFPEKNLEEKITSLGEEKIGTIFKEISLRLLDNLWMNHIEKMGFLRDSTALRAYGGKDSLVEYKKESYFFYKDLEAKFRALLVVNGENILQSEIKMNTSR